MHQGHKEEFAQPNKLRGVRNAYSLVPKRTMVYNLGVMQGKELFTVDRGRLAEMKQLGGRD